MFYVYPLGYDRPNRLVLISGIRLAADKSAANRLCVTSFEMVSLRTPRSVGGCFDRFFMA